MGSTGSMVWMISVYAQRCKNTGLEVTHWPLSRDASSRAEAVGLGIEWLQENYPSSEGWGNYSANALAVFKEDLEKLEEVNG